MPQIFLGLGSNIDPRTNLELAVRELRRHFGELCLSPTYRSRAEGFDGPDFLNLVVEFESDLSPAELCGVIDEIHELAGRDSHGDRIASRTLDIDLLIYGSLVTRTSSRDLPRADILKYDFVLRPLAELAPGLIHPETRRTLADHWRDFDGAAHDLVVADRIL